MVALVNDYEIIVQGLAAMLAPFSDRVRVVDMSVGTEPGYLGIAHRPFTPEGPGLSNLRRARSYSALGPSARGPSARGPSASGP
jgi:hypothetical protein